MRADDYAPGEAPTVAYGAYRHGVWWAGYIRWPYASDGRHLTGPRRRDSLRALRDGLRMARQASPDDYGLADTCIQQAQEASGWDPQPWRPLKRRTP